MLDTWTEVNGRLVRQLLPKYELPRAFNPKPPAEADLCQCGQRSIGELSCLRGGDCPLPVTAEDLLCNLCRDCKQAAKPHCHAYGNRLTYACLVLYTGILP